MGDDFGHIGGVRKGVWVGMYPLRRWKILYFKTRIMQFGEYFGHKFKAGYDE